ncbi:MAG: gliding motility-associated-like protein [Arcticibacterium sp.]|jgi:gliding motility-associated-like protein
MSWKTLNVLAIVLASLLNCGISFGQDLCSSTNPDKINGGFEFDGSNSGCGPFTVKLKDKIEGTDIKYVYYYQGQDKSDLPSLGSSSESNIYFGIPGQDVSNFTILQYGKKADGSDFYSCENVTVNSGNKPLFSYTLCTSGIEIVIPDHIQNSNFEEFIVSLSNSGLNKTVKKSELPQTITFPIIYPEKLIINGIETSQGQSDCNTATKILQELDRASFPDGIDVPFDINIDSLELVEADRVRISFNGSLDSKGYTLQMRESLGNYPPIALKENVIPGRFDFQLPDKNKSYCFKLSRQASCGSYELSAEICTTPITSIDIDKYGQINLDWLNHLKPPDPNQTFNQIKEIEINSVNTSIVSETLASNDTEYFYQIKCGENKVCFKVTNTISGTFYRYKYLGKSISNEVCLESDKIIAPAINNIYTTLNESEEIDVYFEPTSDWTTPIETFFLHHFIPFENDTITLDSSITELEFRNIALPKDQSHCFIVSYVDTCGISSDVSPEACTISLEETDGSNLNWTSNSPFGNKSIASYTLLSQNEINQTFEDYQVFSANEKQFSPDLSEFENQAMFRIKAISENGVESYSNTLEIPLKLKFFIPQAFSPNSDGINDTFRAFGSLERITVFSIKIYNRDGKTVFESNSPKFEWDGGQNSPGTYSYTISISSPNNERFQNYGQVFLF